MFGVDCMIVSRTACKCTLGGSVPLPYEECPRSRNRLCCNERLVSALILPPNDRGGRTPSNERYGMLVVHFTSVRLQTFRPFTSRPSIRIQPIVTQQCPGGIGEIGNIYECLYKEQTRRKNDRKLCVTLWYKKMSGCTTVTVLEICNLWYPYVPMTMC